MNDFRRSMNDYQRRKRIAGYSFAGYDTDRNLIVPEMRVSLMGRPSISVKAVADENGGHFEYVPGSICLYQYRDRDYEPLKFRSLDADWIPLELPEIIPRLEDFPFGKIKYADLFLKREHNILEHWALEEVTVDVNYWYAAQYSSEEEYLSSGDDIIWTVRYDRAIYNSETIESIEAGLQ